MKVSTYSKASVLIFMFLMIVSSARAWDTPVLSSPGNGTQTWNFIDFDWSVVLNSSYYEIQYDTSASFNSPFLVDSVIPYVDSTGYGDTHLDVDELYFGTTYFWRVRALSANDTSLWSTVWTVITKDYVELVSPANASENFVSVIIDWNSHPGIDYYYYQVDTSSTFNSSLLISGIDIYYSELDGFFDSEQQVGNLRYGTNYYWRVCAVNSVDTSSWTTGNFNTKDFVEMGSPISGNTTFTGVNIDWMEFPGSYFYDYQIDTSLYFNSNQLISGSNISFNNGSSGTDTEIFIDNLYFGTSYFWRVRSRHSADTSLWVVDSFITSNGVELASPANTSSTGCQVNLDWNAHAGVDFYEYQIDNNLSFTSSSLINGYTVYINAMNSNTDTEVQVYPLEFGSTYYWKVRAINAVDTSFWSDVWSINTLETITLISPSSFASTHTKVNFDWEDVDGVNKYELVVDTSLSFNSNIVLSTMSVGISGNSISNLYFGVNYFWKVRGITAVDTSSWSETRQFYTLDNAGLFSPADGEMNVDTASVLLDWWYHLGATEYSLEVDTSNMFNSAFLTQSTLNYIAPVSNGPDTEYQLNQLEDDKIFFWRVRVINEIDTSNWEMRWFSTGDIPLVLPDVPVLISPLYNEIDVVINPTLDWNDVMGSAGYFWEISTSPTFDVAQSGYSTISEVNLPGINYVTEYFWRVRSFDGNLASGWSSVFHFTTAMEELLAPVLLLPHNGDSAQVIDNLYFDWEDVYHADSYELVYSPYENFLFDVISVICPFSEYTTSGLDMGTTYYWKVKAKNDTLINSVYSEIWHFTTQLQLVAPVLTSPLNNSYNNVYNNLTLTWESVTEASGYKLQYAKDVNFTVDVVNELTNVTYFIIADLDPQTGYYWRVKANSVIFYESEYSGFWYFNTAEDTTNSILEISQEILAVYPNPTTGRFNIKNPGNQADLMLIRIFDQTGRIVIQEYTNEEIISIDLDNKEAGMYYISVLCNDKSFIGKIIKTD